MYAERYPDCTTPSRSTFANIIQTFKETGNVNNKKRNRLKSATDERHAIDILASVAHNPHVSSRQLKHEGRISQRSVLRILHTNKFHPYHTCYFVRSSGDEFRRRVEFSEWGLRKLQTDDLFLTKIPFTDEATFTNHGQVNLRNMHCWSSENSHWLRKVDKHRSWSVNLWCGLLNNRIIGPYFCDGILNNARYFDFLREVLPQSLDDMVPTRWMFCTFCTENYRGSEQQIWRSLDWSVRQYKMACTFARPNTSGLLFVGYYYITSLQWTPTTREDTQVRITGACSTLSSDEIQRAVLSTATRFQACMTGNGQHFEDVL